MSYHYAKMAACILALVLCADSHGLCVGVQQYELGGAEVQIPATHRVHGVSDQETLLAVR